MQGFNMGRYYAPSATDAPTFNKTHPLGSRAKPGGGLVVRFEMPSPVWCTSCKPGEVLIGQGVRFNAEKRKVGMYYSTPVWEFGMKHSVCGGRLVVRTEPGRGEYVVVEGGRRRDYGTKGEGGVGEAEGEIVTPEERERRRLDAFAAFEGKVGEKEQLARDRSRIEELKDKQDRSWEDPYTLNKRLRREFRVGRKERKREEGVKAGLVDKYGLGVDVVDEDEGDRRRAALVEFGDLGGDEVDGRRNVAARPLFRAHDNGGGDIEIQKGKMSNVAKVVAATPSGQTKAKAAAEQRRSALQMQLKGNTRAVLDPFLSARPSQGISAPVLKGVKRKRGGMVDADAAHATSHATPEGDDNSKGTGMQDEERRIESSAAAQGRRNTTLALVDYDSD